MLTFSGAFTEGPGSLIDGNYTLTLIASKIQGVGGFLDGDANGVGGDDKTLLTHRLFGDSNGDRTVNGTDFHAFRLAFLSNSSTFDFDGDGQVTGADFLQFRLRFLQSI